MKPLASPHPSKIVALHSGGLDSSVMLADLQRKGWDVMPLTILYGQRHGREIYAAHAISNALDLKTHLIDVSVLRDAMRGGSQTDNRVAVPEGHYADETMKATVSPNRNMILLAIATGYAISYDAQRVAYAAHAGDHPIYPDCRPDFIRAMSAALAHCHYYPINLYAPFNGFSKTEIVKLGQELCVPLHLTYSCYNGREKHCGKCGTCVERKEAFELANVPDPTEYE